MRHSIEPRDGRCVKDFGFLSFAKNIGKNLSNKHSQNFLDSAKMSGTCAIKLLQKEQLKKTAEPIGDVTGNKIADKITKNL